MLNFYRLEQSIDAQLDATHFACEWGLIEFHLGDDGATLE